MDAKELKDYEFTWEWFKFHANQRFTAFYYFLLITGALSLGYTQCMNDQLQIHLLTPYVGLSGFLVSLAFLCIEIRNVELVNIGRKCLRLMQFAPNQIDAIYCNDGVDEEMDDKVIDKYKKIKEECIEDKNNSNRGWIFRKIIVHEFWFRAIYLYVMLMALMSIIYYFIHSYSFLPFLLFAGIFVFTLLYSFWFGYWPRREKPREATM